MLLRTTKPDVQTEFGARLLQEVQQRRKAKDSARGAQRGLVGNLCLRQVCSRFGQVRSHEGVFLRAEADLVLVEKSFAQVQLIHSVAVEDTLRTHLTQRRLHLADSGADAGPVSCFLVAHSVSCR